MRRKKRKYYAVRGVKPQALALMVFSTIFTSLGQILWKFGLIKATNSSLIFNVPFVAGFISYGIGALFILLALRKGELSILYPIIATSYVWVSLISPWLFSDDSMNFLKWVGVLLILVSVSVLGIGSTQNGHHNKEECHG